MAKKVPPLTAALTHPELGSLVVNEVNVPAWKEKGWSVKGEEVVEAPADPDAPVNPSSKTGTVKQAAEVISGLDSEEAVEAYTNGDERAGVRKAADDRLDELEVK